MTATQTIEDSLELDQVTPEQYGNAVVKLLTLALNHDGSGSVAAAQVLLNLYNSKAFHVDLLDCACSFDAQNFEYMLQVIKGRSIHGCWAEPHTMVKNGSEHFRKLWEKWEYLHVDKRYKKRGRR